MPCALAVGVFALDQVGSLQRNTDKQSSGSTVGEDRRSAADRNVRLDIPGREKEKKETFISWKVYEFIYVSVVTI